MCTAPSIVEMAKCESLPQEHYTVVHNDGVRVTTTSSLPQFWTISHHLPRFVRGSRDHGKRGTIAKTLTGRALIIS